jgi:hypothetical protein
MTDAKTTPALHGAATKFGEAPRVIGSCACHLLDGAQPSARKPAFRTYTKTSTPQQTQQ